MDIVPLSDPSYLYMLLQGLSFLIFVEHHKYKTSDCLTLKSNGLVFKPFIKLTHRGLVTSRDCETGKTAKCGVFAAGDMAREEKGHGKAPLDLRNGLHTHFEVLGDRGVEDQALKTSDTQFHLRLGIISDN